MRLTSDIRNISGIATVQIEGFFTERFINLCKINNIKVWDIRNIVKGVIRFKINIGDFKKLRKIARKTKCKVTIKEKKGIYFKLFKYRKRKIVGILVFLLILFSIAFSTCIWDIQVEGNNNISQEEIVSKLKTSGIYVGKCKIGLDKKDVIDNMRVEINELSWIGIDINGTKAVIKVVEKTKLPEFATQNNVPGDIIANKAGVITKIIPENGTAKYKEGSYVDVGSVVIEGAIYSKLVDTKYVPAKGIVEINSIYNLKKEYNYNKISKNYNGKVRYTIGIGVNSKENMLNYLNKSKKYDITKSSKVLKLFGNTISFDLYTCKEYTEVTNTFTKDDLINILKKDQDEYLNKEILQKSVNTSLVEKNENIVETANGIIVVTEFLVNEQIGIFKERGN